MEVVYRYDGSFEGFLCCVFDSYVNRERPFEFQDETHLVQTLFPVRWVGTDPRHARRILVSLEKIDPWAQELVAKGFLTCTPDREMLLYRFIRALYDVGKPLLRQLSDEAVWPLLKAVRHLDGEVHLLKGFTRFSDFEGVLAGEIRPKNRVLPSSGDTSAAGCTTRPSFSTTGPTGRPWSTSRGSGPSCLWKNSKWPPLRRRRPSTAVCGSAFMTPSRSASATIPNCAGPTCPSGTGRP